MATRPCSAGQWVRGTNDERPPYRVDKRLFPDLARCAGSSTSQYGGVSFAWQNWTWVVPDEPLCSGTTGGLCSAFAGRSLLFVGDSIMNQQVISLLHLLDAELSTALRALKHGLDISACSGRVNVSYVRNDLLCDPGWARDCRSDPAATYPGRMFANGFASRLSHRSHRGHGGAIMSSRTPSVLVMNSGLHVRPTQAVERHTRLLARWLRLLPSSIRLIWRTGVPGHIDCTSHSEPLTADYAPPTGHKYMWDRVAPHDELRRTIFEKELPGRLAYLDAAAVSNRRADRHLVLHKREAGAVPPDPDCLHYCLPGPPDDWNRVLGAMLST